MKKIGLIGGMSCQSTVAYYEIINAQIKCILGEHHSAEILLVSVNFNLIANAMQANQWESVANILANAAKKLECMGADYIGICCNSAHKVFAYLETVVNIPIMHILDATGKKAQLLNCNQVAVIGNKYTMEAGFYANYLSKKYQINTIIPDHSTREWLHHIIYTELCHGIFTEYTLKKMQEVIIELKNQGAQSVILGCTELPLLLSKHADIPLLNTTQLHALALAQAAINQNAGNTYEK